MYGKKVVMAVGVLAGLGLAASQAEALTLAEVISSGNQIVQGDKVFSNFTFLSTRLSASDITVTQQPGGEFGLRFTANWNTNTFDIVDSVIAYDVTVVGGSQISAVGLAFDGTGSGGGLASVNEQIRDLDSSAVYNISVRNDGAGGLPDVSSTSVTLNPTTARLHVIKDIMVTSVQDDTDATAQISFVDNTFTQVPPGGETPPVGVIPEPMSLALLPLGLLGLGLRRKLMR